MAASVGLLALAMMASAQTTTTSQPATSAPAVTKVTRGPMQSVLDLEGYLEPIDPTEILLRPKAYQGELVILSAAPVGAVTKGQLLLEVDATALHRQLDAAQNDLTAAQATLTKTQADMQLSQQADALALQIAEKDLANAQTDLDWWDQSDSKQAVVMADLTLKNAKAEADDRQDEFDQLKKMYKNDDLTNATADIVTKRATRALEFARINATLQLDRTRKTKEVEVVNSRQRLVFALQQQQQRLAAQKVAQEYSRVLRQTGLASATASVEQAQTKVNDLKGDLAQFRIESPADGVLYYGQLVQGSWQNSNPRAFRAKERIMPGQVIMTIVTPGKLRLAVEVPEAKISWISVGDSARVIPLAMPAAATTGKCHAPARANGGQAFTVTADLAAVDSQLLPGEHATVRIDGQKTLINVLLVPTSVESAPGASK